MKAFLICPVRGKDPKETQHIVEKLEQDGIDVHWPPRDTNQNCMTGLNICQDNMEAIKNADIVYMIWDGVSQGCLFDLGIAFAIGKKVVPIELPDATPHKSFQNMVRAWAKK